MDRRTARTNRLLRDALIALILEKHYDDITVQDIIDRADVGRSTFYAHFTDKEAILIGDWEKFLDMLASGIKWEYAGAARFVPFRELLFHLKDFHHFYRALVRSSKMERLYKTGSEYLARRIEEALAGFLKGEPAFPVPLPVLANHLAATIFQQMRWWLDNNMHETPERMDEIFHALVSPNFNFLAETEKEETTAFPSYNEAHR